MTVAQNKLERFYYEAFFQASLMLGMEHLTFSHYKGKRQAQYSQLFIFFITHELPNKQECLLLARL